MKRIYITLGVLLLGMIAMAYLYFSNLNTETNAGDLSLNAVASNSSIVFSFENDKSFYEILSGQELFQHILGESKAKSFKSLRENLISQPEINKAIDGQKVYVGVLAGEGNQVDYLISAQLKPSSEPQKIVVALNSQKAKINKIGDIYQLTFVDSTTCFLGIKDLLVVISNTPKVIQNILKEQRSTDPTFANYIKSNSRFNKNTLANLYINFNKVPFLLKNILNSNINGELNIFNKQNSFAALSYNFSREKLLFNGNTDVNDLNSYYKLFTTVPEQKIVIDNILPQKTANYTIYTINDYKSWFENLTAWFAKRKTSENVPKNIKAINQKYRLDLNEIFPKYFKNQFVTFQLGSGEKFGAIALVNGEKVSQLLLDLSADYAPDVKIFKESNIPYSFFGDPFKKFERPFYTIIDNYMVMANNASSIQVFLSRYKNNELLIHDENYTDFRDQLSSSATISFYVNNKNSADIFGRNLKSPYFKQYQSKTGFKEFDAFCYQLSGDNGKFLSNLLLYKEPEKSLKTDSLQVNP
ncbi:hypothetical protein GM921_07145 [Pedobacter sp. LMG 31464]|uniref:DUF3352 domain-containing protein n=1 Tax=Pedobacter planticolens TaxID=2679964 RepID=A0A923DYS1_9SPHI|nr:hypothetical protein [Pedobacter planticolens]MBB2145253.1 hypothetical protein [Pedobacter planticolens]